MDLIGGYLLVVLVLFTVNIALLVGNFQLNNVKAIMLSLIAAVISFALIFVPQLFNHSDFLLNNLSYLFLICAVIIFAIMLFYIKSEDIKRTICFMIILGVIATLCLSSQSSIMLFDSLIYSLLVFIFLFFVYQITKLLVHAKREYPVIIGEYMSLFSIVMFIFAFTYNSTLNLNYKMFKPILILTPTYQLIYLLIGICVVMVIGVFLNDTKGGN
ncbi:MAG: hypothetical protein IJF83_09225 [Methanobrevibacter sp.]|nr:hypothetical protein [Methanobrevibacter sp.]